VTGHCPDCGNTLCVCDTCTVLDVAASVTPPHNAHLGVHPYHALKALGVDPDMPFDQFTRCLRYGKNADELRRPEELECRADETPDDWGVGYDEGYVDGQRACLDAIKGDDR